MKKCIAIFFLSGIVAVNAIAQDLKSVNVPAAVKSAVLKKYPQTTKAKVSWEMEKGNYEANWGGKSGEDNSAMFTPKGDFIELVKAISPTKLPAAALAYIKEHEKGQKIKEAGLVTDAKGVITYEAEIKGKELIFDKDGNFIK